VLRFLGFLETMKYILEQSHGVPPVSVALDHTTLKGGGLMRLLLSQNCPQYCYIGIYLFLYSS
jgi:hypothetical protein